MPVVKADSVGFYRFWLHGTRRNSVRAVGSIYLLVAGSFAKCKHSCRWQVTANRVITDEQDPFIVRTVANRFLDINSSLPDPKIGSGERREPL